ncbi:hypothetical protein [Priestia megaterium]
MSLNVVNELRRIEDSIDEFTINLSNSDFVELIIGFRMYRLKGYDKLCLKLGNERVSCKNSTEKIPYLEKYKMIYLSEIKICRRMLKNLDNGLVNVIYPKVYEELLKGVIVDRDLYNDEKSAYENIKNYLKMMITKELGKTTQLLYNLKNYPIQYTNMFNTFIGPEQVYRYPKETIIYKDAYIGTYQSHYAIFSNERTTESTKNTLLNIIAYLSGRPYFYFTENPAFNNKLLNLYEQFDLLDMLRLRRKNFLEGTEEDPLHLELPIFKQGKGYSTVRFKDSQHESLFELYHASLKQFEPLPRCVFLFRVFEYGVQNHYKPLMNPSNYKVEDAIHYYINEVMKHNYNPLYYVDYGTYIDKEGKKVIRKRKAKYVNLITELKKEAKKIKKEWNKHAYLKNKSLGEIIYTHGRNAAAHGGSGRGNARYDYSTNYKLLNNVTIYLELIARYLIELFNPQLKNIVERKTWRYIKENRSLAFSND